MWGNVEISLYLNIFEKERTTKHAVNHERMESGQKVAKYQWLSFISRERERKRFGCRDCRFSSRNKPKAERASAQH